MADVDSAGVYFLSREDFEARTEPPGPGPEPAGKGRLSRFRVAWRCWKHRVMRQRD